MKKIVLKILRQNHPDQEAYWEEFVVAIQSGMTVVSALNEIRMNALNVRGESVAPVVWESNCMGASCGACSMLVNGAVRQACSTFVETLGSPIRLEPLSKFPVIRDLVVDRGAMINNFNAVKGWTTFSGFYEEYTVGSLSHEHRDLALELSSCIACGACLEACPQYNERSPFIGAAPIAQAHLANLQSSKNLKVQRMNRLMEEGGLEDCGNVQNCQKVCPVGIPLVASIGAMNREATKTLFKKVFG